MNFFMRHLIITLTATISVVCFLTIHTVSADDTGKIIVGRNIPPYPDAVRAVATDGACLLSKDKMDKVLAYYQKTKTPGEHFEPFQDTESSGCRLVCSEMLEGRKASVVLLTLQQKMPSNNMHPALGELWMQTKLGRHSEQEFREIEKKYGTLKDAFYRVVDDGSGRSVSEGELIYRKTHAAVHGRKQKNDNDQERQDMKAQAQALRQQAQDLKKRNDIAGLMRLAQQGSPRSSRHQEDGSLPDAVAADAWNLWISCLQDLHAAAYWTKLLYRRQAQRS